MPEDLFSGEKKRVLSVAELNSTIRRLLESEVPLLWVQGEVSNLTKAASGHFYFSLKDAQAQVRCVMFRNRAQLLEQSLCNGQQVEVLAVATLYEQRGDFQLTVEQLRPAGLGLLYERFARLKQKLEAEGLFDPVRKRVLPRFPRRIGLVTSPQAAALRDVLITLRQRLPGVPVVLYPTPVQGPGSAAQIASAIETASRRAECDVLIVCRGGGSIEDLWSFNEEAVARAMAACGIPVVSGIGHETDFTIADFVADERAPTPTAAAQRIVPDRRELMRGLSDQSRRLQRAQRNRLQNAMQAVDYLQRRLVHPTQQLERQSGQLRQLAQRLRRADAYRRQQEQWRWLSLTQRLQAAGPACARLIERQERLAQRLVTAMRVVHQRQAMRIEHVAQQLDLLGPEQVLARGYSMVLDAQGHVVSDAATLGLGDALTVTLARGWVQVQVEQTGARADESARPGRDGQGAG